MSSFNSTSSTTGGGGGGGVKEESNLAEVQASREICLKKYRADIEACKQKCVKLWKDAEDDSVTENEFIVQLNRVADEGMIRPDDKICSYIRIFLKNDYKALNDVKVQELNRLTEVQQRLEAKLNEADDDIVSKVRGIVPSYERVIPGDEVDVNDNLLRINKLIESSMLLQEKHMEEMNRRLGNLEHKLTNDLTQRIDKLERRLTLPFIKEVQFTFSSRGDTNGVFHYIGTQGGTVPYANPHTQGAVEVTVLGTGSGSTIDAIVGRDGSLYYSNNVSNAYVKVDLGPRRSLIPNHYTFKEGGFGSYLRNWQLEGSNNDNTWVTLREHSNDTTISGHYAPGSWSITNPTGASYRYFRIISTGQNSSYNNSNYGYVLSLCCLELYGKYSFDATIAAFKF